MREVTATGNGGRLRSGAFVARFRACGYVDSQKPPRAYISRYKRKTAQPFFRDVARYKLQTDAKLHK